ncbi:MAG TPA: 1-(5-phosphoribosyl)-5-[(5-phosphoribosylamino)methylideneamino]imidazole-4-carboxamide isomerase [Sutterella sp.]|nr:1-(5-phosphoribosyl)-5-[(5-phosphoribosylamino)methylideneamino]imidazole-4-carboxamide isomerase [Sutterella sp.]
MILIPAIDLMNGRCVRLKQGDLDKNITVYNEDPADQAAQWAALGAERIHIVDLDGAKTGEPVNAQVIESMIKRIGKRAEIELGGGIRSMRQVEAYLSAGVQYCVIGTAAIKDPEFLKTACREFEGRIIVALDAKDGYVATHGWVETTDTKATEVAKRFSDLGVSAFLYTDIARDGMLSGVNVEATAELARATATPVIASGGMHTVEDVKALLATGEKGIMGAILGRSLYEGTIDFSEAQRLVTGSES